jgi:hypothetical protein
MYKDKVRTMMRSILPSKARLSSRKEKKDLHREHRHAVKRELHNYNHNFEDPDDSDLMMELHQENIEYAGRIRYIRSDRRNADKVNHFVRWAQERTDHCPDIESRYYTFVSLIGGSGDVIRDHAVGHFINPRYDFAHAAKYGEEFVLRRRPYYRENRRNIPRSELEPKLAKAISTGLEPEINKLLYKHYGALHCKKGPCWSTTQEWSLIQEWEILPDGGRKRIYGSIPITKNAPIAWRKDRIQYIRCYPYRHHDLSKCSRVIQLNGLGSLKRVLDIIYRYPRRFVIKELNALAEGERWE